ncbi:MAG: hypothetical protein U0791_09375 [Gemmataceae bacterium]
MSLFNVLVSKTYDLKGGGAGDIFTLSDGVTLTGNINGEGGNDQFILLSPSATTSVTSGIDGDTGTNTLDH